MGELGFGFLEWGSGTVGKKTRLWGVICFWLFFLFGGGGVGLFSCFRVGV